MSDFDVMRRALELQRRDEPKGLRPAWTKADEERFKKIVLEQRESIAEVLEEIAKVAGEYTFKPEGRPSTLVTDEPVFSPEQLAVINPPKYQFDKFDYDYISDRVIEVIPYHDGHKAVPCEIKLNEYVTLKRGTISTSLMGTEIQWEVSTELSQPGAATITAMREYARTNGGYLYE